MSSPEYVLLRCGRFWKNRRAWLACVLSAACLLGSPLNQLPLEAKEAPVNAIALYDGPTGPAYVQIAGVLVNGKTELRVCDGTPHIDKHTYDTLPRIQLTGAASLERTSGGVLMLTSGGAGMLRITSSHHA